MEIVLALGAFSTNYWHELFKSCPAIGKRQDQRSRNLEFHLSHRCRDSVAAAGPRFKAVVEFGNAPLEFDKLL